MQRIILFGDSLLARLNKDRLAEFEQAVEGSEIYNCAVSGWNTDDGVKKAPYIAQLRPDTVIISFGMNDAASWKKVELDTFRDNFQQILTYFAGSRIILFPPPPVNEPKETGNEKRTNEALRQYAEVVESYCTKDTVQLLDSWNIYEPLLKNMTDYHEDDGVHLNVTGYKILIEKLVNLF